MVLLLLLFPFLFFSAFFSLFFCFFFLSVFLFFFRSPDLLFSCAPPVPFFCSLFPCFYRKNSGERGRGGHCAVAPKTIRGAHSLLFLPPRGRPRIRGYTSGFMVGVFLMLFRERGTEKSIKKLLLPLPRTSRGRRRPTVPFKTAPFGSFCFFLCEQCMKQHRFGQNASFHLKGKGGKNV